MMASREEQDAPADAHSASADEGQVIVHRTMPKYGDKIVLPPGKTTHEEPAPYIGVGWICRINKRNSSSGAAGPKADRFWLNADRSIKLRSIAEVERHLRATSGGGGADGADEAGDAAKEGRPVRKKAKTRSYDDDFVYDDDMMGTNGKNTDGEEDDEESGSIDDGPDPVNPLINSAVALSRGKIHFLNGPQTAVGALLNSKNADGSSKTYAYSWDSILGLGMNNSDAVVGTAAMAQYLKNKQEKEQGSAGEASIAAAVATVTPSQILEMIRSLRPRTCRLPDGSGMVEVAHNKPSENALWYGKEVVKDKDGASALDKYSEEVDRKIHHKIVAGQGSGGQEEGDLIVPYSELSRLYESMCEQDACSTSAAVDAESSFRRECRHMTAPKVVETLRKYENTTAELDQRERDAMKMGNELGLLSENGKDGKTKIGLDVAKYLGYSASS